jgi:hypothetical protein
MFLQEKERDVLRKAMVGIDPFPTDEVQDILSGYNATTFPRANNIRNIMINDHVNDRTCVKTLYVYHKAKRRDGYILGKCQQ